MATILTCRLQFELVGTVFQSEEFHTIEHARIVGAGLRRLIPADLFIVDNNDEVIEVLS